MESKEERKAAFIAQAEKNKANFELHQKIIIEVWGDSARTSLLDEQFLKLMEYAEQYHSQFINPTEEGATESDVDLYMKFRHGYEAHLDWCMSNNNAQRTTEEWHEEKAKDFYKRGLHKIFASINAPYIEKNVREDFIDILINRINEAFSDGCHNNEKGRLQEAIHAIRELVPPANFIFNTPVRINKEVAIKVLMKEAEGLDFTRRDSELIVDALFKSGIREEKECNVRRNDVVLHTQDNIRYYKCPNCKEDEIKGTDNRCPHCDIAINWK